MKWKLSNPDSDNRLAVNKRTFTIMGLWMIICFQAGAQDKQTGCISGNCTDGEGTYIYTDGSKYIGEFVNGKADGFGVVVYADGEKFVGEFRNHKAFGQGAKYHTDGTVEPGYFDANGTWIKAANAKKGCLEGDCDNGYGVKYWDENVKYIGDFNKFALFCFN